MSNEPETEQATVYIVVGRAFRGEEDGERSEGEEQEGVAINVLLTAPSDEECVERALQALAGQGYRRVELDQIGVVEGEPEDPTFASAYWTAVDGQVAVIAFHR
jgi:hypothetical protein